MRGKRAPKRDVVLDPVFKSRTVARLVSTVMRDGKKSTAEAIVYGSIEKLHEDKKEGIKMFDLALKNIMPSQEVKAKRVGGATYQVPMPVKHERAEALAVRWLVKVARGRKGKPMVEKLYDELNNAQQGIGDAIKKRDDTHKMAEANRAFAHFARF